MEEHPSFERVLHDRILQPGETSYEDVCRRVSSFIFPDDEKDRKLMFKYMMSRHIVPASPYLMQAGTEYPQLCSCFTLPVDDSIDSIFTFIANSAKVFQRSGGVGTNWSKLRPEGASISNSGTSTGPVSFMGVFNSMVEAVKSGGRKKGAAIAILNDDHPDIEKFITMKNTEGEYKNFNISVAMSNEFMYRAKSNDCKESKLLDLIAKSIWTRAEPGMIWLDTINNKNPVKRWKLISETNPCLHEDTLIFTSNGIERISSVQSNDIWNGTIYSNSKFWSNGVKDVVTIVTNSGFEYTTTPDHKFMLEDGSWCEAKDLCGKSIRFAINDTRQWKGILPEFAINCNFEVLGFEFGDGNYHKASGRMKYIYFTPEKDQEVIELVSKEFGCEPYFDGSGKKFMINIPYGTVYASAFSGILPERMIPDWIMTLPKDQMRAFLCGLFSANATNLKKYHKIQLVSSNKDMLQQVQMMLLAFGIKGKLWWHNKKCTNTFWNGEYESRQSWHIVLSRDSYIRYLDEIGFIQSYKNGSDGYIPTKSDELVERVVDVSPCGQSEVWDFNEPINHYMESGAFIHNCGEEPLVPYGACNLIGVNWSNFITTESQYKGCYDSILLDEVIRLCVRIGDNAIDLNKYPLQEIENTSKYIRQIGIYPMGVHDALIKMGLSYDSEEGRNAVKEIGEFIQEVAWDESRNLGNLKGRAPVINDNLADGIPTDARNTALTSAAPAGSTSIIGNCSSGIEPIFSYVMNRVGGHGDGVTIVNPLFKEAVDKLNIPDHAKNSLIEEMHTKGSIQHIKQLPNEFKALFKTALDITPTDHIKMQAIVQSFTCSGVSKTINCPESITEQEIRDAIILAWQLGCKGTTFYRQNSRNEVVYDLKKEIKDDQPVKVVEITNPVKYKLITANGRVLPKTPRRMPGEFAKIQSGCGKLLIGIAEAEGHPHTVMVENLGGGCESLQRSVAKLTALALRWGIPSSDLIKVLVDEKCNVACRNPNSEVKSCSAALGITLKDMVPDDELPPKAEFNGKSKKPSTQSKIVCPECGESLIHESGCVSCSSCSYTRCN